MDSTKLDPRSLMAHFNQLTPAELELIAILAEECGEVVQVVGKILRHGLDSYHPEREGEYNRELLAKEIGDVLCVVDALVRGRVVLDHERINRAKIAKQKKVERYLHHSRALFAPAASEAEKVECQNCGHGDDWSHGLGYNGACMRREKPAPPEPAAPVGEMPEAVHDAIEELRAHALMDGHEGRLERASESNRIGKALESWWRTHAQPVARVEMTEELEYVLSCAARYASLQGVEEDRERVRKRVTAVRAQATAPKKLEKVRDGIVLLIHKAKNDPRVGINHYEAMLKEMLDELDAYERGGREGK